jgi:hypothetical protein
MPDNVQDEFAQAVTQDSDAQFTGKDNGSCYGESAQATVRR